MMNIISKSRPLPVAFIIFMLSLCLAGLSGFGKNVAAAELYNVKAPHVVSTNPKNHAGGVLLGAKISATFSGSMNSKTFTAYSASVKGPDGAAVPGTISFKDANSVFVFTPSGSLSTGTRYTVTFMRRVKSSGGVSLRRKYSFSFTTIGDFIYSVGGNGNLLSYSVGGGTISSSPASDKSGSNNGSVAIDPSGKYLYVLNSNKDNISSYSIDNGFISSAPLSVTASVSGWDPYHIAVDPSGKFVYISDWNSGTVSSYSVDNGMLSSAPVSVTAPNSPTFEGTVATAVVDPSGKYLYVSGG